MIMFSKPFRIDTELIKDTITTDKICGDGKYTKKCHHWMEDKFSAKKVLLTTSCTHALEMAALLLDLEEGDEVIMPSFTFSSTANAFALFSAKIVFVDIRPDTMNINEQLIEAAITPKTRAIVPVHYAGVACEMDMITKIAQMYNLAVVEDAAQSVMSCYKGKALGTIGDIGCFSFHETKNYTMGEGGAIVINNEKFMERAEILREKGTNRSLFLRGAVDKYTWVDIGSSYLPSDINAAYLYTQLIQADEINSNRLASWSAYNERLSHLQQRGVIDIPVVPRECTHNAHMYYIKVKNLDERTNFLSYLREKGIAAVFHYVPLHSAPAGKKYSRFSGQDVFTTKESERLVRLPMYYGLSISDIEYICGSVTQFFDKV